MENRQTKRRLSYTEGATQEFESVLLTVTTETLNAQQKKNPIADTARE